jgi:UDP-N-acetylglucosamine--N-acetylmuramyl-(pentapeptide) pyrophosphoryl-undecaprenol N-acetylglucosamine transferase
LELGLDPEMAVLAIMGGSQGGRNLNEAFVHLLRTRGLELRGWQLWHQAGQADAGRLTEAYAQAGISARVTAYEPRMHLVLRGSDLVVSRAGASTLAELTAVGVPAILLPYPYHRDQHQRLNAEVLSRAGAAEVVTDRCEAAGTAAGLARAFDRCLGEGVRKRMAAAARRLHRFGAAERVARELMELAQGHGGH